MTGERWTILSRRYGGDTSDPSVKDLGAALDELYVENIPGMTEADYEEHGVAFIRSGYDDGPMYVVEVTRFGTVRFEEWADQDFDVSLAPRKQMSSVPRELALQIWRWLKDDELERVREQPWSVAGT